MSDDAIIKVENLGKKYRIQHQQTNGMRYKALRDVIAEKFKTLIANRKSEIINRRSEEDFWALKDVSFEVKRGEVVGIIGRNGAGKSTLLKILSRITEPTEGRVRLKGRVASLLEVGTGFHPELTGRENIFLNGAILGMHRAEISHKFDEIVAFAEIEKFLDTPVKRYSSGMYVRLAFAVAAHLEPEILIVDEVLAVGDAEFQKKCLGKMDEVAKSGRTVLFVSHNTVAVSKLCNLCLLLNGGKMTSYGDVRDVLAVYKDAPFTTSIERVWRHNDDAPGDHTVTLHSVRLRSMSLMANGVVDIAEGCSVEIEYEHHNTDNCRVPIAAIQLLNDNGIILFASADFDRQQNNATILAAGYCKAVCHIPGGLLAEGRFRVLTALVNYDPNVVRALVPEAVCFEAIAVFDKTRKAEHTHDWPGVLRPRLEWT